MKKFVFNLQKVMEYKNQKLENKKMEHAMAIVLLNKQMAKIDALRNRYDDINSQFNEKKISGIAIIEACQYSSFLHTLENEIKKEISNLNELKKNEDSKRKEVVEVKIETSTLEKLKEKKYAQYLKEAGKSEELFIEEFVSRQRITN
ncbi:MAG: flagellar export protein FliJ [Clostridia bacterium]|jgi:flagellar FliJ protein|nr:flagellar export protein FliJ [Clostridia bacterium]MCI1999912.1 flagellar export protein FliJ [Clostridia bacterium]MCI2014172.1 flagellar export protein FliJ [Clostridia bacterium]